MGFYKIVFYIGVAMMVGSALLGLLTGILLKHKGEKLRHLLDSEYGPQAKHQKTLQRAGEQIHRVGTK